MQSVEYLAYGMNPSGLLPSWSDALGRLVLAVSPPPQLWFAAHPDDPTLALLPLPLQLRNVPVQARPAWRV